MKEIITVKEKKWCASCEKVGIEGGKLHDEIDNKSNKLVCFFNNDEDLYYLYSLVSGNLITKSQNLMRCISDNYYAIAEDNHSSNRALYYIDHEENSRTQVDSNGIKFITNIFCYYENILIEYIDKKIHITDMYTGEKKSEKYFKKIPADLELSSFAIRVCSDKLIISIDSKGQGTYSNIFDVSKRMFLLPDFVEDVIKELKVYDGKLYIITHENKLIDQNLNVVIEKFYSHLCFHETLPYVYLKKYSKIGLAKLNGEVVFEAIYDEIMETPEKFVVNVCEIKEVKKEIAKN